MKKIQLSGKLDPEVSYHSVGRGVYAENDGSFADDNCWDLAIEHGEQHIGTDYGNGVDVEVMKVNEYGGEAWVRVRTSGYDSGRRGDYSFEMAFWIDSRYLVEEGSDD